MSRHVVRCAATTLLVEKMPAEARVARAIAVHAPLFCCGAPAACRARAVERHPDFSYLELTVPHAELQRNGKGAVVAVDFSADAVWRAALRRTGDWPANTWRGAPTLVEK